LYVDDMLVASKDKSLMNNLKQELSNLFEMQDIGAAMKILDMEIHKDLKADELYPSQRK